MSKVRKQLAFSLFTFLMSSIAIAMTTPFQNLDEIANDLSLATYARSKSNHVVKIAILDNGFLGRDKEVGQSLPSTTVYHPGPVNVDPKNEEVHGLYMAQLVSGLLAKTPGISYELHLYSAFGYTNLATAIQSVIDQKFDVVLYSQVWEYGGNGDGKGFINSLVTKAADAGLVWINASGNFGDATYKAPVQHLADDWAFLPSQNHGVRVRCYENPQKKCLLRAVLSWNDFKNSPDIGTDKDLDLVLSDDTLKILRTGGLQQVVTTPAGAAAQGTSLYPREIVEAELTPGLYELRVKIRSQNFTKANDSLRIVTSGDYLEQLDTTDHQETLLAPADNAKVITVGATDSEKSSASRSMGKPEFSVASEVSLKNGDTFKGSSNSAAMTAALAVIARGLNAKATRADLLRFLNGQSTTPRATAPKSGASFSRGLTSAQLGFAPTGPGCYIVALLPSSPPVVLRKVLQSGAVTVQTTAGLKIMTPMDPFTLGLGVQRAAADDILVATPNGFQVYGRGIESLIPFGSFEVVQTPSDAGFCRN